MENSKSSPSVEPILANVRAQFAARIDASSRITVGLSGGVDSVVLLDALHTLRAERGFTLDALHVNHGISPNAQEWARFCEELCARLKVASNTVTLQVRAGPRASLEARARDARYAALAGACADVVALAHHRDDQAETFLLQALRGAGPRGLAAMPVWHAGRPAFWRPLLEFSRADLLRYAQAKNLAWIEDESNADVSFKRNFIRHRVLPLMQEAFPGAAATLARSTRWSGEAAVLLDALAREDSERTGFAQAPTCAVLASLEPARGRNLLRWFLREAGLVMPSAARLEAIYRQLAHARADARIRLAHAGVEIGVYRGQIVLHAPPPGPFEAAWKGEPETRLPHGTLLWKPTTGFGISAAQAGAARVSLRSRAGGERIRLDPRRPHQALKNLLQQTGMPPWEREALPLVFLDGRLAFIPGLGVASEFACASGQAGWLVEWRADAATKG